MRDYRLFAETIAKYESEDFFFSYRIPAINFFKKFPVLTHNLSVKIDQKLTN